MTPFSRFGEHCQLNINHAVYTLKLQTNPNKFKFKSELRGAKVSMNVDLLYPDPVEEQRKHKLKRLVQGQTRISWR